MVVYVIISILWPTIGLLIGHNLANNYHKRGGRTSLGIAKIDLTSFTITAISLIVIASQVVSSNKYSLSSILVGIDQIRDTAVQYNITSEKLKVICSTIKNDNNCATGTKTIKDARKIRYTCGGMSCGQYIEYLKAETSELSSGIIKSVIIEYNNFIDKIDDENDANERVSMIDENIKSTHNFFTVLSLVIGSVGIGAGLYRRIWLAFPLLYKEAEAAAEPQ